MAFPTYCRRYTVSCLLPTSILTSDPTHTAILRTQRPSLHRTPNRSARPFCMPRGHSVHAPRHLPAMRHCRWIPTPLQGVAVPVQRSPAEVRKSGLPLCAPPGSRGLQLQLPLSASPALGSVPVLRLAAPNTYCSAASMNTIAPLQ